MNGYIKNLFGMFSGRMILKVGDIHSSEKNVHVGRNCSKNFLIIGPLSCNQQYEVSVFFFWNMEWKLFVFLLVSVNILWEFYRKFDKLYLTFSKGHGFRVTFLFSK